MNKTILSSLIIILMSSVIFIHLDKKNDIETVNTISGNFLFDREKELNYYFFPIKEIGKFSSTPKNCDSFCVISEIEDEDTKVICQKEQETNTFLLKNTFIYDTSIHFCSNKKDIVLKDFSTGLSPNKFKESVIYRLKDIDKELDKLMRIKNEKISNLKEF